MIRKSLLLIALTSVNLVAFAGTTQSAVVIPAGVNLLAPDTTGSWSFGVTGLALQNNSPEYQYAQVHAGPLVTNPSGENQAVDNTLQLGGLEFDATYHFAGNDRDVTVAYMYSSLYNSDTTTATGTQVLTDPYGVLPIIITAFNPLSGVNAVKGETKSNYNVVDAMFGQRFTVSPILELHVAGGARYANLFTRDNSTYYATEKATSTVVLPTNIYQTEQLTSQYQGIGPRVSIDAKLHMPHSFSFVAAFGASLLGGQADAQVIAQNNLAYLNNTTRFVPATPTTATATTKVHAGFYVVPELDGRLGVNYQYDFTAVTSLEAEVGYYVVDYFNADVVNVGDIGPANPAAPPPPALLPMNSLENNANFGMSGPYVRLQLNLA